MALVCAGAAALPAWQSRTPAPVRVPPVLLVQSQQERREAATPSDPYEKWVIEDVAYIIDDRERAAYRGLGSKEEKEHFIEQFWARRGTPMKEEHYRRIAYANEQFPGMLRGGKRTGAESTSSMVRPTKRNASLGRCRRAAA